MSKISDHSSALRYLFDRINYERTAAPYESRAFGLDRMRRLVGELGDPHLAAPVVHVAGTKGKGSTAAMIAAALTRAGYRAGLYTSPHLHRLEERMCMDGEPCGEEELTALAAQLAPLTERLDREAAARGESELTFFEITTAMGMMHFARRQAEIVVLEVGLGGRLDSTNVCAPALTLITSISQDHTQQLGTSLESIAREKAGIAKRGVPMLVGRVADAPRKVIEQTARAADCPTMILNRDFFAEISRPSAGGGSPRLTYIEGDWRLENLELALAGRHQADNGALAIAALRQLAAIGFAVAPEAIRSALAGASCPARVEILSTRPAVVIDAAHNVASAEALTESLRDRFPSAGRRRLIFATSRDKDAAAMLAALMGHFDDLLLTRFVSNPRAADPEELARVCRGWASDRSPLSIRTFSDPASAWRSVWSEARSDDVICVAGSFFLAAELRPLALNAVAADQYEANV